MTHPYVHLVNSQIEAFPSLPTTATRVLAITANPESSSKDLIQAILPDQMMCSAILKIANSAFFGFPRKVATIERAVIVLGYEEIRNIVIGKAFLGSLPNIPKANRRILEMFWEHAFTCGLAAKILAEQLRLSPSELFIAGLLHDIGKIAMLLAFPAEYDVLRPLSSRSTHNDCLTEEKNRFGISHAEAGLQLARKWLLPEQLMTAIGFHHSPQDAPGCIAYPLIVQVADIMSLVHCCPEQFAPRDIEKIFTDMVPDIGPVWQRHDLPWQAENIGTWLATLQQYRANDQGIQSLFTAA